MTETKDDTRLTALVQAALTEADRRDNTLVAALLVECVDVLRRGTRAPAITQDR